MKKNVLDESIKLLGINDGDVIEVPCEIGKDVYQYKNGRFTYLNLNENTPCILGEDEVFELINGREFQIIAYGERKDLEAKVDKFGNELSAFINLQKENIAKERKEGLIAWAISGAIGIIALIGILLSL